MSNSLRTTAAIVGRQDERSRPAVTILARRALAGAAGAAHTGGMPIPARESLGEALITTTLLSIYLGSRATAMAIAAAQTTTSRLTGSAI